MKHCYRLFLLAGILLFLSDNLFAQKFKEDFSGLYIYGWKFVNTSSPQPAQQANWQFGTIEPYAGAEYGSNNVSSFIFSLSGYSFQRYKYASVGYTENDYDGADISKWLITPVIRNIKNGDQFQFITRAQPERGELEKLWSLVNLDADGLLSCNRANRLEVRLNTYDIDGVYYDSVNVGRFPNENGHFDKLLLTINPSLTRNGYSQSWVTYTITISGLPENQAYHGRIGFKYYVTNAGYDNCQNPNQLPEPVQYGLNVVSENFEATGKPIAYAKFAYDLGSALLSDQKGNNGTYIGIDNLKYTSDVSVTGSGTTNDGNVYFWNKKNINNGKLIELGYQGKPGCSSYFYPYKQSKNFYLENGTEQSVGFKIKVVPTFGTDTVFELEYDTTKKTLGPGQNIPFTVRAKAGVPVNDYLNTILVETTSGETLAKVNLKAHIDPAGNPEAICTQYPIDVAIDAIGNLKDFDIRSFDAGSRNSCGGTSDLKFSLSTTKFQPIPKITCENLGTQDVYLVVTDTTTNKIGYCKATMNTRSTSGPVIEENFSQEYYLKHYPKEMSLDSIKVPEIIYGCKAGPATLVSVSQKKYGGSFSYNLGKPKSLSAGTYDLLWQATDQGGASSFRSSSLVVIDTIAPTAYCNDTSKISFTGYLSGVGYYVRSRIRGKYDIDSHRGYVSEYELQFPGSSYDNTMPDSLQYHGRNQNRGIDQYLLSTPWKGLTDFRSEIPFTCEDAGAEFPVTLLLVDRAGNSSTCTSIVQIQEPDQATCRNINIMLDPENGFKLIEGIDVLEGAGDGICGITNMSVYPNQFTCEDVNKVIPVEASYLDASGQEHSCSANVTVKEYSEPLVCEDTIEVTVPAYKLRGTIELGPIVKSVCSEEISWNTVSTGVTSFNENHTGSYLKGFAPGISTIARTTIYEADTFRCQQTVLVTDSLKPLIISAPSDLNLQLASMSTCTYAHEIVNPFENATYTKWSYTLSGANTASKTLEENHVYFDEEGNSTFYYQNQWVNLKQGLTHITLQAWDLAGNMEEVSYDVNLYVQNPIAPYVWSEEFEALPNSTFKGDFCGEEYLFHIESPVSNPCEEVEFMWYYEVRDAINGNILFEKDSIPQNFGADIPLKAGPKFNQTHVNYVYLGYHEKVYGVKTYSTHKMVVVADTLINEIICPESVVIENNNTSDYTFDYEVPSPIVNGCEGSFWGYSVSGATYFKTKDESASYNSNQQLAISTDDLSARFPSLAYNENSTVTLNPGKNRITYRVLEESGNVSIYGKECTYNVEVVDVSEPEMTCPPDDTVRRSTLGPCEVTVGGPCHQVNGFTEGYGINELGLSGGNTGVTMDYSTLPDSVSFINHASVLSYADSYLTLIAKCDGTLSFSWEYQCDEPKYFRPFINYNSFTPGLYSQPAITGFNENSTIVQTGTFSQTVSKGEYVIIGVTEGGKSGGYFKIKNFSAPYFDPSVDIVQPTFAEKPNLTAYSNIQTQYPIGTHEIVYNLLNLNNGKISQCFQKLYVIDDFATTLSCSDQTLYLNNRGFAVLKPENVISTCFDVSNTTISKDTFLISDLGTHNITITSMDQGGMTHNCTFDVAVLDTIKPVIVSQILAVDLNSANSGTIADSTVRKILYDNVGIETYSLSKSTFSCDDIGTNTITITATDPSGNSITGQLIVEVYPDGFVFESQDQTAELCVGESKSICSPAGSATNSLSFQWQTRQPTDSLQVFNSSGNLPPNSIYHKFLKLKINQYHDNTYMVYSSNTSSDLQFRMYNGVEDTWGPALKPLPTPDRSINGNFFMDAFPDDNSPYVVYLDQTGAVRMFRYAISNWTEVRPGQIFNTVNKDFNQLFYDDGYFFPVLYNGKVHAAKEYYTAISELWDIYTAPQSFSSYVSNAKNIVGIRNTNNQNIFYRLNLNPASMEGGGAFLPNNFGGKDSLTVDPTGNSALFVLKSFEDEAYVAYKSASGKVTVKKFDGTSNWTLVGEADFSEAEIFKLDLEVVNGLLHVAYIEASDKLIVKKWDGSNWVDKGTGSLSQNKSIELVDLGGDVVIYSGNGTSGGALYINDGWVNIPGQISRCMNVNTSEPMVAEYRTVVSKNSCASQTTSATKVVINEHPTVAVTDTAIVGYGSVTLKATRDIGTLSWLDQQNNLVASQAEYETPLLVEDAQYRVFASNGICNSDTLTSYVFVNNDSIQDIVLNYKDSVCSGEYAMVRIENPQPGYHYSLYELGEKGYALIDGPQSYPSFYIESEETKSYKIKALEPVTDATSLWGSTDYVKFDQQALNITNEVTIEAYVQVGNSNPELFLGSMFGDYTETTYNLSWEWGKYFKVYYEGGPFETLVFPSFSSDQYYKWVHIATTAGPEGMEIYYDGVLVASKSFTHAENIRPSSGNLTFGLFGVNNYNGSVGDKAYSFYGLDEVRVWNTKRTANEINQNYTACLEGNETGLVLYNKFDVYNSGTFTFTSVAGPNSTIINPRIGPKYTVFRSGECYPTNYNEKFFEPFTITMLQGESTVGDLMDFYETETYACGGEEVEVYGEATNGTLTWYSAYEGGEVIGTGDTLRKFFDRDTIIYAGAGPKCERWEVEIDIQEQPRIISVSSDTVCAGSYLYDANIDVEINDDASDYELYDAPVGGNLIDPYESDYEITESDTLYAEAFYEDYDYDLDDYAKICSSAVRVPVYINVVEPKLISFPSDTTMCGEGTVTLKAKAENGTLEWWQIHNPSYGEMISNDSIITQNITSTSQFAVGVHYELEDGGCYSDYAMITITISGEKHAYDTIVTCSPYTWIDGKTYSTSDADLVYVKSNPSACDSVFHLNLMVDNLSNNLVTASKYSACVGGSSVISVSNTKATTQYTMIDISDNRAVDGPKAGNGGTLTFSTGALTDTITFRILTESSLVSGTKSLTCNNQLAQDININVGTKSSMRTVIRCGSYLWNGTTYTESGVYYKTLTSSEGCDSIAQLNLTLNSAVQHNDTVTACDSYTWHGETYTASTNTPTWTGKTAQGCDSVVTLQLTMQHSIATEFSQSSCGSYNWNGTNYPQSGDFIQTLTSATGCDSVVTMRLTVKKPSAFTQIFDECPGYSVKVGTNTYTTTGIYTDVLTNSVGCDSVVTTNLTIKEVNTSTSIAGTTIIAEANPATYQWIDCNNSNQVLSGETGQSMDVPSYGSYAVIVSQNGCTDTSLCESVVITDANDADETTLFKVYPSPAQDRIQVELPSTKISSLTITDAVGVIVYTQQKSLGKKRQSISVDDFASGIYFVYIETETGTEVRKFFKE